MQYTPIVKLIMEKGVDNISLPDQIKFQILSEAGRVLFKAGRYEESGKAFAKANNTADLESCGKYLMQQIRPWEAMYFFVHTSNKDNILSCASQCVELGYLSEAKKLFECVGDTAMMQFLELNFGA
jgi:hypothetical protein